MGADRETSVVDPSGRTHDVPNLVIADGATFPCTGGVPTTLTIMANALRIGAALTA